VDILVGCCRLEHKLITKDGVLFAGKKLLGDKYGVLFLQNDSQAT
jgi:hypothetical protein